MIGLLFLVWDIYAFFQDTSTYNQVHHLDTGEAGWQWAYLKFHAFAIPVCLLFSLSAAARYLKGTDTAIKFNNLMLLVVLVSVLVAMTDRLA
ncbi:hypothetical protein AB9P05_23880 [Roseivirga sp. BDSF3-8]|uniref:hypothetical protein n=1 Tax=Roseivirga sp. BDSF3-8 TaxID=3241598 RepID=UPI0035322011